MGRTIDDKVVKNCCRVSVSLPLLFLILASSLSAQAAIIYFEFRGEGSGNSSTQAIENAVLDAQLAAASQGYGDCQLSKYTYYRGTWDWLASAWTVCSKDTNPPPPPPPPPVDPPEIFPPIRSGGDHVISWGSSYFSRFALEQRINNSSWKQIYKGNDTSKIIESPVPATYRYRVLGISGAQDVYSSEVEIVVSSPPGVPELDYFPEVVTSLPFEISWGASAGADQYILEERYGDVWRSLYIGSGRSWSLVDVEPGVHSYRVIACKNYACSSPSSGRELRVVSNMDVITNYIIAY